jgi:hypothetical protein
MPGDLFNAVVRRARSMLSRIHEQEKNGEVGHCMTEDGREQPPECAHAQTQSVGRKLKQAPPRPHRSETHADAHNRIAPLASRSSRRLRIQHPEKRRALASA